MSPLEKCAKAMADADDAHFFWEAMSEQAKSGYMDAARACLEAIKEPDDGMMGAASDYAQNTRSAFTAMIDHILSQ